MVPGCHQPARIGPSKTPVTERAARTEILNSKSHVHGMHEDTSGTSTALRLS